MNKWPTRFTGIEFSRNVSLHGAALTLLLILTAPSILCQSSQQPASKTTTPGASSGQTSPEAIAAAMWQKMAVVCPVSGAAPATFIDSPDKFKSFDAISGTLIEYRGAWTRLIPIALTDADRLNGFHYKALALMSAPAQRDTEDKSRTVRKWSEWQDLSKEWTPKTSEDLRQLRVENALYFEHRYHEVTAVRIERRANEWSYKIANASEVFNPDDFAATRKPCAELTRTDQTIKRH